MKKQFVCWLVSVGLGVFIAGGFATQSAEAAGAHSAGKGGWAVMFTEKYKRKYFSGKYRVKGHIAQVCASQDGHHCTKGGKQTHKRHGKWEWFWPNGKLKSQRSFAFGSLEGTAKAWYSNGQLRWVEHYSHGKLDGKRVEHFANGKVKSKTHYKKGRLHGKAATWWWNGKKATTGAYELGKKTGVWNSYYVSGHQKSSETFKGGVLHGNFSHWWFVCRPAGCGAVKMQQGFYKKGQKSGRWTYGSFGTDGKFSKATESY